MTPKMDDVFSIKLNTGDVLTFLDGTTYTIPKSGTYSIPKIVVKLNGQDVPDIGFGD